MVESFKIGECFQGEFHEKVCFSYFSPLLLGAVMAIAAGTQASATIYTYSTFRTWRDV
jgi:hypothetical protein